MAIREKRSVDSRARVTLPKGFAKATVILEQVSETEVRVRLADASATKRSVLAEEQTTTLSDRDRDRFLKLLAAPPLPTAALRKAIARSAAS